MKNTMKDEDGLKMEMLPFVIGTLKFHFKKMVQICAFHLVSTRHAAPAKTIEVAQVRGGDAAGSVERFLEREFDCRQVFRFQSGSYRSGHV